MNKTNKVILIIWVIGIIVLDAIDIITTVIPVDWGSVRDSNFFLQLAIDAFGSSVGIFVFGPIIKILWLVLFSVVLLFALRFAATIHEKNWRYFSFGALYLGMTTLWFIRIPAIIGNLNPYLHS